MLLAVETSSTPNGALNTKYRIERRLHHAVMYLGSRAQLDHSHAHSHLAGGHPTSVFIETMPMKCNQVLLQYMMHTRTNPRAHRLLPVGDIHCEST